MPTVLRHPLDLPPQGLALRIGQWPGAALLESGPGFGAAGRWSVLAARPRLVFEARGERSRLIGPDGCYSETIGRVWEELATLLQRFELSGGLAPDEGVVPFQGGLIGYLGYDLAPLIERLPRKGPRSSRLPDLRFGLYDTAVTVDNATGAVELWCHDLLGEGDAATERRATEWREALRINPPRPPRSRLGKVTSNFSKEEYFKAVRRSIDYIEAGDIFQVNLSQRFEATGRPEPLDLYLRLRMRSPAPFSAFLAWDDLGVVSASPEWFLQTRGDWVVTRPIKGTRPRGTNPDDDARLAAELAGSPKDRAELTMIVDLERNDLGRVCRYGSVKVTEALEVESFAQVHHLVATVEGRLRPDVGPVELIKATFPGGSITGAPKIRAMEIIDELEPTRRGLYTGAIGYISRGASALNIAIRTMIVEGDHVSYQVGGGIVADSDPLAEYHETLDKGRAMREVLGEEGGLE